MTFPDDFHSDTPGSPFAKSMSVQALRFDNAAAGCRARIAYLETMLDAVCQSDPDTISELDVALLLKALDALADATRKMQEVEKRR